MSTVKVVEIIRRVDKLLKNEPAVRWTHLELQDWLNDAYREILLNKPDAYSTTETVALIAGTRQRTTDASGINKGEAVSVLDVVRNMAAASTKAVVRKIDRAVLDDQIPGWHAATASVNVQYWCYDPALPKEFLVYPPAAAGAQVELAYSRVPINHTLTEPQLDPTLGSATASAETIRLDDVYANALLDYVMFRAYSKDADYAANVERAAAHRGLFKEALGIKNATDSAVNGRV